MEPGLQTYAKIDGFICPPEFWTALGYRGQARWVGIYWEQCGDEAAWHDGQAGLVGANWLAYLMLLRHNFSPGHPYHWLMGASDAQAVFWIVVDRETEAAWLVAADRAPELLREQWPADELVMDVAVDGVGVIQIDQSPLEILDESIEATRRREDALVAALTARPAAWHKKDGGDGSTG